VRRRRYDASKKYGFGRASGSGKRGSNLEYRPVEIGKTYFVTVMPYDAHGESVERELYAMSNEIKVKVK